ncbi:uncharacterized protein LOC141850189 [Brevipalpus obovatus]|uniref:uncharacterized protein LOC141850189 n=1 Tax=Brevipalpus obovatus TaxID=246614 RepID=UPI003D9E548F
MDCLPSLSLVRVGPLFRDLTSQISFRYPTIVLVQFMYVSLDLKLDDEIFETSVPALLDIPESCLSDRVKPFLQAHIEAIHVNRFASDHKIIITNWSDPESTKPNFKDPEYPVRAFIYFVQDPSFHHLIDIVEFMRGFDFPVMQVCVEEGSLFYVNPSKDRLFQRPAVISIAFGGKQIQSSMHSFQNLSNESDFTEEVTKFKNNIKFPTDDGRVLGFVIHRYCPKESRLEKFTNILMRTFGSIKMVSHQLLLSYNLDSSYLLIFLIRI